MRLEGVHGDMSFNHRCPAIFAGLASASTLVVPTDAQALTVGGVSMPTPSASILPFALGCATGAAVGAAVTWFAVRRSGVADDAFVGNVTIHEVSNEPEVTRAAVAAKRAAEARRGAGAHARGANEPASSWVTGERRPATADDYEHLDWADLSSDSARVEKDADACKAAAPETKPVRPCPQASPDPKPASGRRPVNVPDPALDPEVAASPVASEPAATVAAEPGTRRRGGAHATDDYEDIATNYVRRLSFAERMAARARGVANVLGERLGSDMMDGVPVIERADGSVGDVGTGWWNVAMGDSVRRDLDLGGSAGSSSFSAAQTDVTAQAAQASRASAAAATQAPKAHATPHNSVADRLADLDMGVYPEQRAAEALDSEKDMWERALDAMESQDSGAFPAVDFVDVIGGGDTLDEPDGLEGPTKFIPFRTPAGHPEVVDTESYVEYLINDEFSRNESNTVRRKARSYLKVIEGGTSTQALLGGSRRGRGSYVPRHMAASVREA